MGVNGDQWGVSGGQCGGNGNEGGLGVNGDQWGQWELMGVNGDQWGAMGGQWGAIGINGGVGVHGGAGSRGVNGGDWVSRSRPPPPGLCVFLNVCHSREVPPPPPLSPDELWRLLHGPDPSPEVNFRIPMSLGEPHAELDKAGQPCTAYDVVVNSGFFHTLKADPMYLEFFLTVAMEGLSEKYGVELDLNWRVLQNRKFLGSISTQSIRMRPRIQELEEGCLGPRRFPAADPAPFPSGHAQEGAGSLHLGLNQERLELGGAEGGAPLLQLELPLPPDPTRCHAHFHRGTKVTVAMATMAPP
uniref:Uncharacterized protein n=1 Tax=Melopsittacus undulatus TaxID=13146 RepID=A0A8V5GPZ2_MELUD